MSASFPYQYLIQQFLTCETMFNIEASEPIGKKPENASVFIFLDSQFLFLSVTTGIICSVKVVKYSF